MKLTIPFFTTLCALSLLLANNLTALSLNDLTKRPSLEITSHTLLHNGKKIIIGIGDITKVENVDAIVNAANAQLRFGSGIAGSIALTLGLEGIADNYRQIKKLYPTPVAIGSASRTTVPSTCPLGKTGFKYLIHAVGPDCRNSEQDANWPQLLCNAYEHALGATKKTSIRSIIIPSLSTGVFGCPQDEALEIMMQALVNSLKHDPELTHLQEIILIVWSGNSNAPDIAAQWLTALNSAVYDNDTEYTTLVGVTNPNT